MSGMDWNYEERGYIEGKQILCWLAGWCDRNFPNEFKTIVDDSMWDENNSMSIFKSNNDNIDGGLTIHLTLGWQGPAAIGDNDWNVSFYAAIQGRGIFEAQTNVLGMVRFLSAVGLKDKL